MTSEAATRRDPSHVSALAHLGRSRARVLEEVADAGTPIGVAELAHRVGLHSNTVRFHLDALVADGLATRGPEETEHPGRPRMLYQPTPDSPATGRRSYQLLAEILASHLAARSRRPAAEAAAAGREWGRYLAPPTPPFGRVDATTSEAQLVRLLNDIGFEPELVTAARQRQLLLHHCPFREIAAEHGQVVCAVHLGLMQGFLHQIGAPLDAVNLEPFVEPTTCRAHLAARGDAPRD